MPLEDIRSDISRRFSSIELESLESSALTRRWMCSSRSEAREVSDSVEEERDCSREGERRIGVELADSKY